MRPSVHFATAILSTALFAAVGCSESDDADDEFADGSKFRCGDGVAVGLVGLEAVEISGSPTITGKFPHVFSNGEIRLSGDYTVEGDVISAKAITLDGREPGGKMIDNAPPIAVGDPSEEIAAARAENDNEKIPCVYRGNKCRSPVDDGVLVLRAKDELELSEGRYYFTRIEASGQSELRVRGEVTVYVEYGGSFSGRSSTNPDSDSLRIISNTKEELTFTGRGETSMHVYAPLAEVRLSGRTEYRGSLLARTLTVSGKGTVEVTRDLLFADYAACDPEPDPKGDDGSEGCGQDDGTNHPDGPTEPPPDQLP